MATVGHFFLILFFTLNLLVQARLNLQTTDHEALLSIHNNLGVTTRSTSLCNAAGVFCERRISNNITVLRVTRIVFKHRRLSGSISPAIGKLSELKELSLPNNHLVNQIPVQITNCRKLEVLNLKSNRFSGKVPTGLSSLAHLRILDLSSNKFTGKVPASLRSFRNLRFFNISNNSFLDKLESPSTEEGNNSDNLPAPAPSPAYELIHKHKNKKKRVIRWILEFSFGIPAVIICGTIFYVIFNLVMKMIGKKQEFGLAIFSGLIKAKDLAFLEKDDEVASLQIIGNGGCGVVYKAELQKSGVKAIAIKKVTGTQQNAAELMEEDAELLSIKMRQIKSEIETVGQIRHRNLLPLLAHVARPHCHYLVYEFMKNGSLEDVLQEVKDGIRELDWLTRHRIALGVAIGLEYLHLTLSPRVVHRDLKPANVLIDDNMEARITDFGLAKAIPDVDIHIQTFNVAGTLGYMAPEYYETRLVTDKCDIYSFGVLLATLVMGKLPTDDFFKYTYEMGLVIWMRNLMTCDSEDRKQLIDPKLMGNGYEEQMIRVLKIACFCTLDDPRERPTSKDARLMLAQIHPENVIL
ncbi:putative transferase, protein kinase RLK-Pelle-LRR-XI-2 family [Helianthus annuus]|nr:putative transferase, protein kinase RLK-Pelle-LRR-XI-2 family [Helianthus annuus]